MRREKNSKVVIGCSIVAAICFGIVSYGHFYRGRMALGLIFSLLTIAQLALAWTNSFIAKKSSLTNSSLPQSQREEQDE